MTLARMWWLKDDQTLADPPAWDTTSDREGLNAMATNRSFNTERGGVSPKEGDTGLLCARTSQENPSKFLISGATTSVRPFDSSTVVVSIAEVEPT